MTRINQRDDDAYYDAYDEDIVAGRVKPVRTARRTNPGARVGGDELRRSGQRRTPCNGGPRRRRRARRDPPGPPRGVLPRPAGSPAALAAPGLGSSA